MTVRMRFAEGLSKRFAIGCNRLDELQTDLQIGFQIGFVKAKVDLHFLRV